MNTFFQPIENQSREYQKLFAQRTLIHDVTEDILIAMSELNINKAQLANRLGKSKAFITQTLNGTRNMTLATLTDICFELNITPKVNIIPKEKRLTDQAKQILQQTNETKPWAKEHLLPQASFMKHHSKMVSITQNINYGQAA